MIYEYTDSGFKRKKHINANLIKRHKKGGQSSIRFARLAEESRHHYVTYILDHIGKLEGPNWIFGSEEIVDMIVSRTTGLNRGGFLLFDNSTITDTQRWLRYLKINVQKMAKENKILQEMLDYIAKDPDQLDFDPANKEQMKYYMHQGEDMTIGDDGGIKLTPEHQNYEKLCVYEYIGIKYYSDFNYEPD